jgi:hypothetical protein
MDFEIDDATQKISSASNRVSSLSSQSSKGNNDVSSGVAIPNVNPNLEEPYRTIQEFTSALDIDYSSDVDIELSDIRLAYRALEINGLFTGVKYKGENVVEKEEREIAIDEDRVRAGKLVLRPGSSQSSEVDATRQQILQALAERFGQYDPAQPFPLGDFLGQDPVLTPPISSSSSSTATNQTPTTLTQNSSQRTMLTPPTSTGPPGDGGSDDSDT